MTGRQPIRKIMRTLAILIAVAILAPCGGSTPAYGRSSSPAPAHAKAASEKAPPDSVVQFLLTSAARDFRDHGPSGIVGFRRVRIGHLTNPAGHAQYFLYGEFQTKRSGSKSHWTSFATIKTSGYELWIGDQAAQLRQRSSVIWDTKDDLSASLQRRLTSL